jgi:hypothetical protein
MTYCDYEMNAGGSPASVVARIAFLSRPSLGLSHSGLLLLG